jgi:hypothetical protein
LSDEPAYSEESLLASLYYHSQEKGCEIAPILKSYNKLEKMYMKQECLTHQVILSKEMNKKTGPAGWQLGFFGGTSSINYK